jgi:predicted methyltransferase
MSLMSRTPFFETGRALSCRSLVAIVLAACCCLPALAAAEQNASPGINRAYQDPDVTQWLGVFERDGREVWDRRHDILETLDLQPGMAVADVGAGTGFFSTLMAERVSPGGRVYAVDIARNFVDAIEARAASAGLDNIVGIVNDQQGVGLAPNSVDLVFVSDTYHHFEYPMAMLASIHRALRPGGRLVVIDFIREPGFSSPWVLGHVRAGEAVVRAEIESAGFRLSDRPDFMRTQYFLRFDVVK